MRWAASIFGALDEGRFVPEADADSANATLVHLLAQLRAQAAPNESRVGWLSITIDWRDA